jgi:iron(III) transport system ATP-binding protein
MEGIVENGPCCLTVRPESIELSETDGPLVGTISRATYYGAKVEYEVMLNGQPIIVEVYNPQLTRRFAEGDTVHMSLIDGCVRVLL